MINVAFIGAGRMGLTHIKNLAGISSVRVIAVADVNLEAAEHAKNLARAEVATTDFEAVMQRSDVDAVVIVTPTNTHASLIQMAARAGKAIWCEKPIALTIQETLETIEVVNAAKVPCQIGFMRRFDPGYVNAKRLIEDGSLGKIETFRALGRDTYLPNPAYIRPSGGMFLDMSVHDLDLARFLIGEVEEVSAWGSVLVDEMFSQADDCDTSVCMLRFENGVLGVVENSRHSNWGYDIRTEIAGSVGKVVIEGANKTPITHYTNSESRADVFDCFPDRFEQAYRLQLEAFFSALQNGKPPNPGVEEALATLRLALAARQSWREKRPVKVSEVI
jgi:myo-inositol 2-dehydrogenase / D-chiro-inositol 1-dehydrogenase